MKLAFAICCKACRAFTACHSADGANRPGRDPGARSNWHTHPGRQAIYILEGCGWTQREGGPITKICKGDTAYVPAGVKHCHGAPATTGMTQLAVTEMAGGKKVTRLEPVSDAQFQAGTQAAP